MVKVVLGILVSMLMIGSVLAGATFGINESEQTGIGTVLFEIEDGDILSNFRIDKYQIEPTKDGELITADDFGRLLIPGKPDLPSKIFSIAIPPGAIVADVSFETTEGIILPGEFNIPPSTLPRVTGEEKREVYMRELEEYEENYNKVYGSDEPYPSEIVEFAQTSGFRKYNLVDVRVNPFIYRPISKEVTYYPDIMVQVSYTFPEGFDYNEIMMDDQPQKEQLANEIVHNYDQAKNWYPTAPTNRDNYDYVIITTDSLTSYITDLVDWEESKGKSVYVATTSWISSNYNGYDLAEKMRNFLREKYPSDQWGIEDVCLIGNYNDVPMRRCAQSTGYGQPRTDFYYAELSLPDSQSWDADGDHQYGENSDPIDFYAEVNVGRIPWSQTGTVQDICEKTVAYEQNNDPSFKKNILLIGAFFWADTDNAELMEAKTDSDELPWMAEWTKTTMYEDAQSSYPCDYDISYQNVKNVWSQGTFAFVDWAGHGSPTACYEYYPSQAFVDTATCAYLNDNYPAIVFADACSNSDTDYTNIGQKMMEQGAIGFLGATQVAYGMPGWNSPYDGSSQSLDYFFTTKCTSGDYTQGEAQQWGLVEMYTNNLWYYLKYETFQWGALWGNPDLSMGVTSQPPATPGIPDGPSEWILDVEATFEASTIDPEEDSIYYMFDWGDGTDSGWVGPFPSGDEGSADHAWTELGEYQVTVRAKDVYGATSDWSESATITIVENSPPSAPTISGPPLGGGQTGKQIDFEFTATDPEGHQLYYYIVWDDGYVVNYDGPYASGETVTFSHAWSTPGSYTIKAKAMDQYEAKGPQSSYTLRIIKNKPVYIPGIPSVPLFMR